MHSCTPSPAPRQTATRRAYACRTFSSGAEPFFYQDLFESPNKPETPYKKLEGSEKWVSTFELDGKKMLKVEPEALTAITTAGMTDIAHLLRPAHLQQLSNILADPEASENDKFVAIELLKNANVAAGMVLPGCQDTGTGIIVVLSLFDYIKEHMGLLMLQLSSPQEIRRGLTCSAHHGRGSAHRVRHLTFRKHIDYMKISANVFCMLFPLVCLQIFRFLT